MGSIIKTISLDGRTTKIAETIPNFSQWIRAKLLELEEKRVTPRHGWHYHCHECGHAWTKPDKDDFFYCLNRNSYCKTRLIPKEVDLE